MPARKMQKERPEREEGNQRASCGSRGSGSQARAGGGEGGLQEEKSGWQGQAMEATGELS